MLTAIVRYSVPLMPIRHECCSCHEPIRYFIGSPAGYWRGEWQTISHGLCPPCARKLYGAHAGTSSPIPVAVAA